MVGWCFSLLRRVAPGVVRVLLAVCCATTGVPSSAAQAQNEMWSGRPISFDIPAQPLERALLAYGAATGIQILYDASLVSGKRSSPVSGRYPPQQTLEMLLRETGLRVRYTSPGAITLSSADDRPREVMTLDVMRVEAAPLVIGDNGRFNGYGQTLQGDIIAALRRHPVASRGRYEVVLRVWVGPDGAIARSELLTSTGQEDHDGAIIEAVRGVGQGRTPPRDLPQPILFRLRAQPVG